MQDFIKKCAKSQYWREKPRCILTFSCQIGYTVNMKLNGLRDLAINGGTPIMSKDEGRFIHPIITPEIEKAVVEQLHDNISIYNRSNVFAQFEDAFKNYHDKKHGLVTSSGTTALWSLYDSLGLKKGDEVICPIYTFHATVNPLLQTGAKPIFIDCDETGNIDPNLIESKINERTKAIMVTHMWGQPCMMDKISAIAKKYNLPLLEDASHAHGASYQGKKTGAWGDASAFSLQGNKIITGGEGGIVLTDDDKIYQNAILHGHFGKRTKQEIDPTSEDYKFAVTGKGLKLRAHPLAIRIALEQFKNLDEWNNQKSEYAKLIAEYVKGIDGIELNGNYPNSVNSGYAQILKVDPTKFNCDIEQLCNALVAEGGVEFDIPNSTSPLNTLELYKNPAHFYPEYEGESLLDGEYPQAKKFSKSIIKMPLWYQKSDERTVDNYGRILQKVSKAYGKD